MSLTSIEPSELDYRTLSKKSMNQDSRDQKKSRKVGMLFKLDFYFPFFVFFYGLVMFIVLEIPYFVALAKKEMPYQYETFLKHRKIAAISFYVGGLWSLQNIWFS